MRKNYQLWLFVTAFLTVFIYVSCRKLDYRQRNTPGTDFSKTFFQLPLNAPSPLKRVAESIKEQDKKFHFINDFVKKQGLARWDRSVLLAARTGISTRGAGGEDSVVLVPLVKSPFASVHGFLACVVGKDSVKIRLFDGSTYGAYGFVRGLDTLSAAYVAATTMILNHRVFGDSIYHITDNNLFNHPGFTGSGRNIIIDDNREVSRLGLEIVTEYCIDVEEQLLAFRVGVEVCQTTTEWIEFVDPTMPTGTSIPTSGSGGACEGWWCINPCRLAESIDGSNPCGNADDDLGWEPVPIDDEDRFNPEVYDEVRINQDLRDSFPCIASLIEDSLFDINRLVQISMYDHFTVNQYNHVYFTVDWNLSCGDRDAANTATIGVQTTDPVNHHTHWTDTIKLNPCFLRRASRETVVGTIMHETIHAYINWCINEYVKATPDGTGLIDSFYLKDHFPLHWQHLMQYDWGGVHGHEVMASEYINFIASVIYSHGNHAAPSELRRWVAKNLAGGGLNATSAWGHLTDLADTCTIKSIVYWGQHHHNSGSNPFGVSVGASCNTTFYNFRDSLQMLRADSCQ